MAEPLCYRTFYLSQPFRLLANARSHLRYTKTHFPLTENVGRVILEEYYRGDITVCVVLTIAVIANFYMLPERELASPQAMTEGCATKLFISD